MEKKKFLLKATHLNELIYILSNHSERPYFMKNSWWMLSQETRLKIFWSNCASIYGFDPRTVFYSKDSIVDTKEFVANAVAPEDLTIAYCMKCSRYAGPDIESGCGSDADPLCAWHV